MLRKTGLWIITIFLFSVLSTGISKAQGVSIDYFYDQLSPYGQWFQIEPYGWVWQPDHMYPGWKPYSDGYWVYTDYGWTYQADNNWSWAAYHYGRWAYDNYYGWMWVPGTVWSPAWVAWRNGGNYVGWAPLSPEAEWVAGVGLRFRNFNVEADINWSHWCFVDFDHFDNPKLTLYIQNPARNITIVSHTRNITRYEFSNNHIFNRCIDADEWQHMSHRPIVRYNIADAPSYRKVGVYRSSGRPEVRVYRPNFISQHPMNNPHFNNDRNDLSSTRRYNRERKMYDKHYDKQYYDLIERQKQDNYGQSNREEIQRQHDAEFKAYKEQRNRDSRMLENRHINDMEKLNKQKENNKKSIHYQENNNGGNEYKQQGNNNKDQDQPSPRRR
jgi:hypothetical protein